MDFKQYIFKHTGETTVPLGTVERIDAAIAQLELDMANANGQLTYKGQWNASTNSPDLNTFSLATPGEFLLNTITATQTVRGVTQEFKKDALMIWNGNGYDYQEGGGYILATLLELKDQLGYLLMVLPENPYGIIWAVLDPSGKVFFALDKYSNIYNPDYQATKALLSSVISRLGLVESNFQPIDPNPYGIGYARTDPTGKIFTGEDKFGTLYNPDYQKFKSLLTGYLPSIVSAAGLATKFIDIDPNPYGLVDVVVDPTGKVYEGRKQDGNKRGLWFDSVAAGGEKLLEDDTKILFGPHLFTVEDRWFQLYGASMLQTRNSNSGAYTYVLQSINEKQEAFQGLFHAEDIRLNGSWFGGTATIKLKNPSLTYVKSKTVTVVKSAANKVATPRVNRIGNSLYDQSGDALAAKFVGSGVQPIFVGSRLNGLNTRGNGAGGWQGGDFDYAVTNNGHNPLPIGSETQAYNLGNETRNPFIRVATGSDDPADVKNGYIFDYGFFLNRFSSFFAAPDIVLIDLGTNDFIYQGNSVGFANAKEAIRIIVKSIKAALPNCKIGLEIPQPYYLNTRWKDAYSALMFDHIQTYGNRSSEGIYIVSSHAYTTSDFIFPVDQTASGIYGEFKETITDGIHHTGTPFGASLFLEAGFQFIHAIS